MIKLKDKFKQSSLEIGFAASVVQHMALALVDSWRAEDAITSLRKKASESIKRYQAQIGRNPTNEEIDNLGKLFELVKSISEIEKAVEFYYQNEDNLEGYDKLQKVVEDSYKTIGRTFDR